MASEADIDKAIAFHLEHALPAIKVYERLTRDQYDSLVAKARKNGLRIIGHVPEAVGLAHALESGQLSIEHLDGYSVYLTPDSVYRKNRRYWQSTPLEWVGFVASFADIDENRIDEAARMTRDAGTWNCPTLVVYDHYLRIGDPAARAGFRGAAYLAPYNKMHWDPQGYASVRRPSAHDFDEMKKSRPKLFALVRALDAAGAGLLVGTDSVFPGIVPGYSTVDEIELFVEAGVTPWRALRAATSGAAEFLGQSDAWGQVAVGRRADLLLLRGNPLEAIANIELREGVMVRGRWMTAGDLDARLAAMVEYNTGKRSHLAEMPVPAPEGTRELAARYTMHHGGEYVGEQRVVIDRRGDGSRVITVEAPAGTWSDHVRIESSKSELAARHADDRGVLELRRIRNKLTASYAPAGGASPVTATFDIPPGAYLNLPTLAPDQLMYPAAMKLRPGGQVTSPLVSVTRDRTLALRRQSIRFLRRPDRKDAPGARVFAVSITSASQTLQGDLLLDADGHLLESTFAGDVTRRAR